MVFYLDSSAVLKRYRTEKGTDVVDALYESGRELYTSHFTCLEVESVAARTLKTSVLANRPYETLLRSFARDLRDYISLEPFDGTVLNDAINITRRTKLRPADSIQLAAAVRCADGRREFVLVASDKELLAAVEGAGIRTLDPEADNAMEVLRKTIG